MPLPDLRRAVTSALAQVASSSAIGELFRQIGLFAESYTPGAGLDPDPPPSVGLTNAAGVSPLAAHGDHEHAHGDQPGGTLHAAAVRDPGGSPGFVEPADLALLDTVAADVTTLQGDVTTLQGQVATLVPQTRQVNTTAPLTGGGALSADLTLGISPATTSDAGSMSAADKAKLDGLAPAGFGFLYGLGLQGAAVLAVNTTPGDSQQYTTLAINAGISLNLPNYALECSSSLTLAANALITADGIAGAADSTIGALGVTGNHLGVAGTGGGGGGSAGNNGTSAGGSTRSLGGLGGAGGNNGIRTGGNAGPLGATTGLGIFDAFALQWRNGNPTFVLPSGGTPGGGGAGGAAGAGGGGGSGGALLIVRAKAITVAAGALFRAKGGAGGARTASDGSGGGGGGGGVVVVICDSWAMPGGSAYADFFDVSGGAGGTSAGGLAGNPGNPGKVRLFVAGVLVYSLN